jgi:hypothetical protein
MTAHSLQASLCEVQRAYFIGLQKRPALLTADPLQPELAIILEKRLSAEQQHLLKLSQELCNQGLAAARKGELVTSARAFQAAEAFLQTEAFSTETLLISRSLYEAALAYLDYRNAEFERAISRLHTALALDLTLEEIPGYALIQVHRIRLLLNMLRIQIKRSAAHEAMQIGTQIMDYLENKACASSLSTWDASRLSEMPQSLKELQFTEAVGELATLLTGVDTLKTGQMVSQCFAGLAAHIDSPDADSCYLSPQAHTWLRAKQALINEQPENFLRQALPLLSQGRTALPQLWYATVVDLLCLCQRLDLPEARMIKQEIIAAAPSWPGKHFPATWQALLHLSPENHGSAHMPGTKRAEYSSLKPQSAPLAILGKAV